LTSANVASYSVSIWAAARRLSFYLAWVLALRAEGTATRNLRRRSLGCALLASTNRERNSCPNSFTSCWSRICSKWSNPKIANVFRRVANFRISRNSSPGSVALVQQAARSMCFCKNSHVISTGSWALSMEG